MNGEIFYFCIIYLKESQPSGANYDEKIIKEGYLLKGPETSNDDHQVLFKVCLIMPKSMIFHLFAKIEFVVFLNIDIQTSLLFLTQRR